MSPISNRKKIWKTSTENSGKAILWEGNFLVISKGELKYNVLMLMDLTGETDESRPWTWSQNSLKKEVLNNCYHYCFVPLLGVFCDSSYCFVGVANGTSKNVGLGKFWQDLEISEAFLVSLEVSFFHGLLLLFLSLETFHQRVSGSDF